MSSTLVAPASPSSRPSSIEHAIVIGSGPAAWTSAIYLARANLAPLVLEGEPSRDMIPGGQLMFTTDIENFPGFPEPIGGQALMAGMRQQAERYGARILTINVDRVTFGAAHHTLAGSDGQDYRARGVIIATGARANWLGLAQEQRLARIGGGVSACAVCDGPLPAFRGATLVVVGGGDSALEEALALTHYAREVIIVHRRDQFRASPIMAQRVLAHPKIHVEWHAQVVDVIGEDFITGVVLEDTRTQSHRSLACGGLFVAIGHTPNTAFLGGQLPTDAKGYLIPAQPGRTLLQVPGVYAAGDVSDSYYRQAVTAAGSGCMAALELERWLAQQPS